MMVTILIDTQSSCNNTLYLYIYIYFIATMCCLRFIKYIIFIIWFLNNVEEKRPYELIFHGFLSFTLFDTGKPKYIYAHTIQCRQTIIQTYSIYQICIQYLLMQTIFILYYLFFNSFLFSKKRKKKLLQSTLMELELKILNAYYLI